MNSSSNADPSAGLRPAASCYRCCTAADRTCSCRSVSADWSASRCTPCLLLPLPTVVQLSGVQPCTRTRLQYFHRALVSQRLSDTPQDIQFQHGPASHLTRPASRVVRAVMVSLSLPSFTNEIVFFRQILHTWCSLHLHPSRLGHFLEPLILQLDVSGLAQSLSGSDCFGSVGVRPDSDLRSQLQIYQPRLHSKAFCGSCYGHVVFCLSRAQMRASLAFRTSV